MQETHLKTHTNLKLDKDWYGDEEFLKLEGDREETEQETESRVCKERVSSELSRLGKLAQLNKLKQELGIN